MNKKKVALSVNELRIGMVIAENIINNGITLLKEGTELNDALINKLQETFFFNKIIVYCNKEQVLEFYKNKTVEEIEKSFSELSINIKEIFDNIDKTIKTNFDEIENFISKVKEELHSPKSVIKNVILLGSREDSIYRHSVNVTALSVILGKWLELSEEEINILSYSAILHDFGKTKIDRKILNKNSTLSEEEWETIKLHPAIAYNLLKGVSGLDNFLLYGVLMHHERLDGSGYPLGIKEERIHPFAKIIAIADTFDTINSNRKYKRSQDPFTALKMLQEESLGKLDYIYCKEFIEHVINFIMGESVLLSDNRICTVVGINLNDVSRPLLINGTDFIDLKEHKDIYIKKLML